MVGLVADMKDRVNAVRERIALAAQKAGRKPHEVRLVAVSKGRSVEEMIEVVRAGVDAIGENRVQEAAQKRALWPASMAVPWHMVGHLQRNKASKALDLFDIIQSVDSIPLAYVLSCLAARRGKILPILLEVNASREGSKYGFPPEEAVNAAEAIAELSNLSLLGLMTIGPLTDDRVQVRSAFELLRELRDKINETLKLNLSELSMGMSDDFEMAVEEGSTMVRIGRAIFDLKRPFEG
ncbi:YggS family pyridoxal phosphate-dependent enzyme [Acetomicrobium sp. S15 = DSM 107314]|uniref:YggS family pyridoxal phosphate-dependent enzyme n=1 Tax=Acetomicrobium sp. S15 = DSM 107314 TaxID=2529858 RepID=UPI001E29E0C5|nr:YggS family pyridoxal phosphate-dependent enzyme [Acetomicrobium sp. S15 = DSM 107314]